MEFLQDSPEPIKQVHLSLEPFIKSRHEALHIRRVLAAHLRSHVGVKEDCLVSQPLSLAGATLNGEVPSSGVRGIRRDYVRSIRANVKAKEQYENSKRGHQLKDRPQQSEVYTGYVQEGPETILESFFDVVKCRRKHERLRIVQDYIDMLAQKPAAAASHLDPEVVLRDVESLPNVPKELMNYSRPHQEFERTDLKALVGQLEKSVLRAKLMLKKEQRFLAKIKSDRLGASPVSVSRKGRLQALGMARNELINWIEIELAKAGESSQDSTAGHSNEVNEQAGKGYIENRLQLIQRQYSQYIKIRQSLVFAAIGRVEPPPVKVCNNVIEQQVEREDPFDSTAMSHVIYPYLEELTYVSNMQKHIIQQKSYLTTSLAKQLKEVRQGFDRLGDESHLLLTHPLTLVNSSHHKGPPSFSDEISSQGKLNSKLRARAWVFASDSATSATRKAIDEKLEEGKKSTLDAQQTLSELYSLFGEEAGKANVSGEVVIGESMPKVPKKDIWGQLDGQLGVIKTEE